MKNTTGPYPVLTVDGGGSSVVPNAGATLLLRTAQTVGLPGALSTASAPWRRTLAVHDPATIVLDLAVSSAIGGDCLACIAQLRACPEVFGLVVVAEGVEDLALSPVLAELGCDAVQGFAIARPMAGDSFLDCLTERTDERRPLPLPPEQTDPRPVGSRAVRGQTSSGLRPVRGLDECDHDRAASSCSVRSRPGCGRQVSRAGRQ